MSRRGVLAGLGLAAVVGVLMWVSWSTAQPRDVPQMRGGPPGRFICAYGSATDVLVLDTVTGTVFHLNGKDFKSAADLQRMAGEVRRDGDRPPPVREGERPVERRPDGDKPKERREDGDKPKERREEDRPKERREDEKPKEKKDRPPFEKERREKE